ncbi:MAG TPA: protein kinase, partial [Candidatus Melainabacteria bacterium]|nr:protein kinase [Candidatus Melainabacteria bacterium]
MVHRDIKPENLIVYESKTGEEIKIIDFGIAKSISMEEHGEDLTLTGEIIGTPAYMSPEQCLGENIDPRSDLYSLGCVAYEMVSGRKPFSNQSALKVLSSHVN